MRDVSRRTNLAAHLTLIGAAFLALAPIGLALVTAFTSPAERASSSLLTFPSSWTLQNFADVLGGRGGLGPALAITATAAIVLLAVQLPLSFGAAHALAILRTPFPRLTLAIVLGALLVPPTALVIPLYLMLLQFGLAETFPGIVLPALLGSPYAVFLFRQHLLGIPRDLLDAGRLDGLGPLGLLRRITVPLSRGPIVAIALITVVTQWNGFLWPSVIAGGTWPVAAVATASLQTQYRADDSLLMAAATLAILPMVLLFAMLARPVEHALSTPARHL